MRIATVWQNLEQITARYGKQADEILGNSLAKLILGPIQDAGTRDYLVDLLDTESLDELTYDVDELGGRRARSLQRRDRAKASAQTLQQLARGEGLLIHGRDLPVKGRVLAYWERRDLAALVGAGQDRLARMREPVASRASVSDRRSITLLDAGGLMARERSSRSLSVEQFADRSEVPAELVRAIEAGRTVPSVDELAALLAGLELRLDRNAAGELSFVTMAR